jgi:hypothetical protein
MLKSIKKTPADPIGAIVGGLLIMVLALHLHERLGLTAEDMAMLEAGAIMVAAAVRTMLNDRTYKSDRAPQAGPAPESAPEPEPEDPPQA